LVNGATDFNRESCRPHFWNPESAQYVESRRDQNVTVRSIGALALLADVFEPQQQRVPLLAPGLSSEHEVFLRQLTLLIEVALSAPTVLHRAASCALQFCDVPHHDAAAVPGLQIAFGLGIGVAPILKSPMIESCSTRGRSSFASESCGTAPPGAPTPLFEGKEKHVPAERGRDAGPTPGPKQ